MSKVIPIPGERACFWVWSDTQILPWRVDLEYPATCGCQIEYCRTDSRRRCYHITAAFNFVREASAKTSPRLAAREGLDTR